MYKILSSNGDRNFRKNLTRSHSKKRYWVHQVLSSISIPDTIWTRVISILSLWTFHYFLFSLFLPQDLLLQYLVVFTICFLLDAGIVFLLPFWKISFGSFPEQIFVIHCPRIFVSLSCILLVNFFPHSFYLFTFLQFMGSISYFGGMVIEPSKVEFTKIVKNYNKVKKEISFIHLSDVHVEKISKRELQVIQYIQNNKPDFIFFTGDYLNLSNVADPQSFEDLKKFIQSLTANYGIFASMGSPPVDDREKIQEILESVGVKVLRDQQCLIELPSGDKINLLGVDCDHRQSIDSKVAEYLAANIDPNYLSILLFHSPEIMPQIQNFPIDIYLCGHTHGGQIRLPIYGAVVTSSVTGKKYEMGSYVENGTHLYVSRGLGLEGKIAPRMRLFCRPETIHWKIIH